MDKESTVQPTMKNGTIQLGYDERGVSRKIFSTLMEAGVKHETASRILTGVDDLYKKSYELHKAFDLEFSTLVSKDRKIGNSDSEKQ